ncbi:MAG: ROK family protein [Firmicutes bacterium]|nr:ROK family protein [Bacillota bacterium]
MKYYVGIDLGGTNIVAGVVDETGKILCKYHKKTNIHQPFEDLVTDIASTAYGAVEEAGMTMNEISSVGLGTPSVINPANNLLVFANNLGWSNVPLPAEMAKHFDIPVYIQNDANCAALGEVIAGAARNYENAILITLGTGVGGGVILHRKIFGGCDQMGGELGHTKLIYHGVRCTCGQYGCLESYASATALIRETKEAMAEHPESLLHQLVEGDLSRVEARTVFDAAHQNDATALAVVDQYIDYLAAGLSSFVSIFRPDVLIIGGGISAQGDYLLDPLNEKLKGYTFSYREIGGPKAIRAELGNDAGIIGAAMLELSEEGN